MLSQLPNLNGLKAFEATGRHLNFRAAAQELGVTQGAVAQQVRALEAGLGVMLFERHSKGLSFTSAGRSFHGRISEAFALMRGAMEDLRPGSARVIISVPPSFAAKWLIPNLPDLSAAHPDIDLRVMATDKVSSFRTDGIDLAVRLGSPPFGASLQEHLLFSNDILAVAAPSLVRDCELPLSVSELAALPRLHDDHDLWPLILHGCDTGSGEGARGMRFNQTALALDAAIAGQGVALSSGFLVSRDLESGRLAVVARTHLDSSSALYLLHRKGVQRSSAVLRVVHWLRDMAGKSSPLEPYP